MATLPKIVCNFNENDASTIRDYSENGNDGTGTGLTIADSASTGKEAVFNSSTDQIDFGNITDLNGAATMSASLNITIDSTTGNLLVVDKSLVFRVRYNYTTNQLGVLLWVASGTATVSAPLVVGTRYDVHITYSSGSLKVYVDGVEIDEDTTKTGVIDSNSNNLYIGDTGSSNSAFFKLNEFKLFDKEATQANIDAWIAEPNGIYSDSSKNGNFAVGDVIGTNLEGIGEVLTGVVSWVGSVSEYRILPISSNILAGQVFRRLAHLWDTTRQWALKIDDTPQICFYDGMSKSSEIFAADKKTYCLTKEGITKTSSTKTANYTIVGSDQRIYVDSSGGAFTITLEASPTTDREVEIIDSTGNCNSFNVTVAGNGNNIIGSSNYTMSNDFDGLKLIFNGTNWNLN
jgi:hypothetical protein